jgi:predicted aspartyl protease
MTRYKVLSFVAVLVMGCSAVQAGTHADRHVLSFKLYGQQLIVVQGSIGPLEKRNLVIDTGAYPSVIDREVARKLSLSGVRAELDAIDRTISSSAVIVPDVVVGPVRAVRLHSLVEDLSGVSRRAGIRIDGLIGLDVLAQVSFRIDYRSRKIAFGLVDPLPSSAPFRWTDKKLCVDLDAGARSLRVLIDTGAEELVLFGPRVPWIDRSDSARLFSNLGDSFVLKEVRLQSLRLGETELKAQPIYVSSRVMPTYSFDGFLSTVQFQQVAFDFERYEFSWMERKHPRERIHVASAPVSGPSYNAGFANETAMPRNFIPPAER